MYESIKLIALDIDGTLLDDKGNISVKTVNKIRELVARGIYVVLVTGRVHKSASNIADKLSVGVPIISNNGGKIVIPSIGQIFNVKIPFTKAKKIIRYGEEKSIYTKVYIDDILYVETDDRESINFSKQHGIDYRAVGKLSHHVDQDVNMIVFICEDKISNEYFQNLSSVNLSITMSTPHSLEIMAKGISKGYGLKVLAKYLGINRQEILAVGNSLNDLEMLQFAGIGIAMKNSDEILLEKWQHISHYTNNEEGVYELIKQI